MADITSSKYPVVGDSQEGDQYVIVRASQLKKQTRTGLDEHVASLGYSSFIGLTDTPGNWVGKVGQTLAVNLTEDGLEFVANSLSPTFATLPDVNTALSGNGGKVVKINSLGTSLEYAFPTFAELADGAGALTSQEGKYLKVNAAGTALEWTDISGISNVVLVESESDLPELNVSGEHELAANTAYWFNGNITYSNPIRFTTTSTEIFGNGIGETSFTYTGTGYGILADNGLSSVRLRYIQYISSSDGVMFVGGGAGAGTNVSLDRAYVIATAGTALNTTSQDFLFMSAAVVIGQNPIVVGGTCGKFTPELSLIQTTANSICVDLGAAVLEDIIASGLIFDGVAGSIALSGTAGSANIGDSASFLGCIVESGLTALAGITVDDLKYKFTGNTGISDSQTEVMAYIDVTAPTTIISGTAVPIAGDWLANPDSARATVTTAGIIEFENLESTKGIAQITMGLIKSGGGGTDSYLVGLQKSLDGITWNDVVGMESSIDLVASASNSLSISGIASFVSGDQFRVVITGVGTTDSVTVTNAQVVIG